MVVDDVNSQQEKRLPALLSMMDSFAPEEADGVSCFVDLQSGKSTPSINPDDYIYLSQFVYFETEDSLLAIGHVHGAKRGLVRFYFSTQEVEEVFSVDEGYINNLFPL